MQMARGDLFGGGEDAKRNRQIEAAGFLGQVSRRQVDGYPLRGEFEAAVLNRRADPILGFLYFSIRKANDGKGRQAVRQMHFDADFLRLHAGQGATFEYGE
jgi:hypothetical protein